VIVFLNQLAFLLYGYITVFVSSKCTGNQ